MSTDAWPMSGIVPEVGIFFCGRAILPGMEFRNAIAFKHFVDELY